MFVIIGLTNFLYPALSIVPVIKSTTFRRMDGSIFGWKLAAKPNLLDPLEKVICLQFLPEDGNVLRN
jgi:hypothetical protein